MQHTYNFLLSCLNLKRSSCNEVCKTHSDHPKGISSHSTVLGSYYTICSSLTSTGCDTNGKGSIWSPRKTFFLSNVERIVKGSFWRGDFYLPPIRQYLGKKFIKSVSTRNCQTNIPSLYISTTTTSYDMYMLQLVKLGVREVNIYLNGSRIPPISQKELWICLKLLHLPSNPQMRHRRLLSW